MLEGFGVGGKIILKKNFIYDYRFLAHVILLVCHTFVHQILIIPV